MIRENLNQSMRSMRSQSFKRRWEDPLVKQKYQGKFIHTLTSNLNRIMRKMWV